MTNLEYGGEEKNPQEEQGAVHFPPHVAPHPHSWRLDNHFHYDMGTINMVMMMTTMVSNVKTFVKIEAICNSGGQTTNVSGRANKCVRKSGRVSQAKQIDALEMRAPHVSVWFPLERGPICNEVRVSEAFQI